MAIQKNVVLTGRVGKFIFYKRNGKYCVRAVPGKVRQTKATRARAGEFGNASRLGRLIRELLLSVIPFPADNNMQTRLVTTLLRWLRKAGKSREERINELDMIGDFRFTPDSFGLFERWRVRLEIISPSADLLQIKIPEFVPVNSLAAPAGTESVKLKLAAGSCNPDLGSFIDNDSAELSFPYNDIPVGAQTVSLKFSMPGESLVVTGAALEYTVLKSGKKKLNSNKAFMPAGIIGTLYL